MKKNNLISIIVIIGLVVAASIWYGRNNQLLPVAAGDEALLYDGLFNTILAIAFGFFLVVEGVLIYSIVKFRRPTVTTLTVPLSMKISNLKSCGRRSPL